MAGDLPTLKSDASLQSEKYQWCIPGVLAGIIHWQ
jgi:hypothetical protein